MGDEELTLIRKVSYYKMYDMSSKESKMFTRRTKLNSLLESPIKFLLNGTSVQPIATCPPEQSLHTIQHQKLNSTACTENVRTRNAHAKVINNQPAYKCRKYSISSQRSYITTITSREQPIRSKWYEKEHSRTPFRYLFHISKLLCFHTM